MNKRLKYSSVLLLFVVIISISFFPNETESAKKINGICFVAPPFKVLPDHLVPIKSINANWVAVTPYAISRPNQPEITYNHKNQWYGEKEKGTIETVVAAKNLGLKVMMKPHIWVLGQGWAGDYDLEHEKDWKAWEHSYSNYILRFAKISDSLSVEMICIGTEYKNAIKKRPTFWVKLIDEIRSFYGGKITYAANWDNFESVTFWNKLDYIGIDAYFPICQSKTPTVEELEQKWQPTFEHLKKLSTGTNKPLIFTEFGYRSMDYTAAGHWELDHQEATVNLQAQKNATEALFNRFWNQDWFMGGFLWKWHANNHEGGKNDSHYTPQNKPTEQLVKEHYGLNQKL